MILSDRLRAVVSMVPACETVADIGCDHGKTAVWLLRNGRAKRAVCGDISAPSLEKAGRLAALEGLSGLVSLRVGSGFDVLEKGEAEAAVVAGMGGELMASILERGGDRLPAVLVLSCHRDAGVVRKWLAGNGFVIADEDMVLEKGHYYPVIRAEKGRSAPLTDMEREFGPVLLRKKPALLKSYVQKRIYQELSVRGRLEKSSAAQKDALLGELDARVKSYNEVLKWL